jgi:hypothetical protein
MLLIPELKEKLKEDIKFNLSNNKLFNSKLFKLILKSKPKAFLFKETVSLSNNAFSKGISVEGLNIKELYTL